VRRLRALAALVLALFGLAALAEKPAASRRAIGQITASAWPYFPGSIIPVRVDGFPVPYHVALVGPGTLLDGGLYAVPGDAQPGVATLIAGNEHGLAERNLSIRTPLSDDRDLLAVVSYDQGIVFHDARTFAVLGLLGTGGMPSDAAIDVRGRLAATDTQGTRVTLATLVPWNVTHVSGVPFGDEIAIDEATHAIFVTNRDINGRGALTRVDEDGQTAQTFTGQTAEGLAVDERRQLVYVANVNDGTVAAVDARSMRVARRFPAVARVFSLALTSDGNFLYGISNQSLGSPFAAPGSAVRIGLRGKVPRVVARSPLLTFPIGAALDSADSTLFVTDEALDQVDVLDSRTLRAKLPPVSTCHTPWKPAIDSFAGRLYVPCARANVVDVFDVKTMRRIAGAPFATGGYPLAVAVWHSRSTASHSLR
jgi:DNA-binding beta-propeller fold protein YncE